MIRVEQAVIVEGKYDKIKLSSIIDAVFIQTDGFKIFKDDEKRALIRYYAEKRGIIILTDSDSAGFKIRNYVKGIVKDGKIINVYIPDVFGKEKRKQVPSKEGKIGVEGIAKEIIIEAFQKAGVLMSESKDKNDRITKLDLYEDGFVGGQNSSYKRCKLLQELNLPELLTTGAMLDILNTMFDKKSYKEIIVKNK